MAFKWANRRVLITVRTYPVPAAQGIEVSCTAAIGDDGTWLRLFPVPYRLLTPNRRFKKYQWIDVDLKRASKDTRPESHNLNTETIKLREIVSSAKGWAARRAILKPLTKASLCAIRREQIKNDYPTLGIFRPNKIKRLVIRKAATEWTTKQKALLSQTSMDFAKAPREELEKIPFDFLYEFECTDPACSGHTLSCTDWEMGEAYRKWRRLYGAGWEAKFRQRFEAEMIEKYDTHFFVGTVHMHPRNWIIVGLFYPPKSDQGTLF